MKQTIKPLPETPISLIAGDLFRLRFSKFTLDGSALPIGTYTWLAEMWSMTGELLATFAVDVVSTDPPIVDMSLDGALITDAMAKDQRKARWFIKWVTSGGDAQTFARGPAHIGSNKPHAF